jgi:ATP-dependent RNA helicase DHX29
MAGFAARQASPAYQEMLVCTMCFHIVRSTHYFSQYQRNRLPIAEYRDVIISTLNKSQILVLSGETGW